LATDDNNSFVCALSSINLEYWDEYKDNKQFFLDIAFMMDNVLEFFITFAPKTLQRAVNSTVRERSIGLGVMGFHSYLQSKMVPFECAIAKSINNNIFKTYRAHLDDANKVIGGIRGEPEILVGTGNRFTHVMALAPTASNSLICGNTSPSIEPWRGNAFRQDTLSGSYTQKNKFLDGYLNKWQIEHMLKEEWIAEQWQEVVNAAGSVQQLKWMPDEDKEVFKNAAEIDNLWIIEHAADRQLYVDQAQSINLFIEPTISVPRLHAIHFAAWKKGLKTLY
jgi:ribonucleoside-diphosphate reductase alpha chain